MIFLTGGTGFLGRELVGRLLVSDPQAEIALLVRPTSAESADLRVKNLLVEIFGENSAPRFADRVRAVPGDVSERYFGLGQGEFEDLARRTTSIYHSAATTALNEDLSDARRINVGGTSHVLELASFGASIANPIRVFYVSTAYVAGLKKGVVTSDELQFSAGFRNFYEQTKAEAEALVRDASARIPTVIFRPSIIVGDSVSGQTSAFNVIYVPAKLLLRGLFRFFPANPDIPFDVVPVDYVADAVTHLSQIAVPSGTCFHLTVGLGRESSPWEILEALFATYNKYRRTGWTVVSIPPLVSPELLSFAYQSFSAAKNGFHALERVVSTKLNVFRQTLPFIPYMISNPRFDSSDTSKWLGETIAPPLFPSYAENVFRYCLETNFGRKPWENPGNLQTWNSRVGLDR